MAEVEKRAGKMIREHGFMVMYVGAGDGVPQFAYTMGLTERGRPELFITGPLPPDIMHGVLSAAAVRALDGEDFRHGQSLLIERVDTIVLEGPPRTDMPPNLARRRYGRGRIKRLHQIVWPNNDGAFPWAPGWGMSPQPLIADPPEGAS